ncbi:MAG: macrocin O-methyltransferase [Candidatus Pacebacteria bacterium]|nr:macrocin O-methyltransferase [Candidatus Paceibacterota bacterium]
MAIKILKGFCRRVLSWKIINDALGYVIVSTDSGYSVYYNDPERLKVLDLVKKIKGETEMLLGDNEGYQLYMAVKSTSKIDGDIAEVGTYMGGSAKIICEARENDKYVYLFDTFNGLPELSNHDNNIHFQAGEFKSSLDYVANYLKEYSNVFITKGLFPQTADIIKNKKFSFVNLDVDLHEGTRDSLDFFYPRMSRGGVIISHDYISTPGVKKAFDEFFKDKPEPIIELSGSQCLIIKL